MWIGVKIGKEKKKKGREKKTEKDGKKEARGGEDRNEPALNRVAGEILGSLSSIQMKP